MEDLASMRSSVPLENMMPPQTSRLVEEFNPAESLVLYPCRSWATNQRRYAAGRYDFRVLLGRPGFKSQFHTIQLCNIRKIT